MSITVEESIFDNFPFLRSVRVPSTTPPSAKTGIRLRNQKSAVVTLLVKNFAQKSHFDNFSAKSFEWTGIGKGSYGEENSACRRYTELKRASSKSKVANCKSPILTIVLFGSRGSTAREKEDNKWVL